LGRGRASDRVGGISSFRPRHANIFVPERCSYHRTRWSDPVDECRAEDRARCCVPYFHTCATAFKALRRSRCRRLSIDVTEPFGDLAQDRVGYEQDRGLRPPPRRVQPHSLLVFLRFAPSRAPLIKPFRWVPRGGGAADARSLWDRACRLVALASLIRSRISLRTAPAGRPQGQPTSRRRWSGAGAGAGGGGGSAGARCRPLAPDVNPCRSRTALSIYFLNAADQSARAPPVPR
jgi:hypothetical protein